MNSTKLSAFCDRVIEVGWLAAVIVTPLLFNAHSSRIFDPDKITVLRSIALVMAAVWTVKLLEERASGNKKFSTHNWANWRRPPKRTSAWWNWPPRSTEVWRIPGSTYAQLDRLEEAIAAMQEALELEPEAENAWNSHLILAALYSQLG